MSLLIGTDEAGYGPNFGPLVITGTSFRLPPDCTPAQLWECLSDVLTCRPERGDQRLHVADSKQVYSSGRSIRSMETSVLAFLALLDREPATALELGDCVDHTDFAQQYQTIPPQPLPSRTLPVAADPQAVKMAAQRLQSVMHCCGIQLLDVRSRIVFPPAFNREVRQVGSKGKLLSATTLHLVRQLVDASDEQAGAVVCDKHGGRNRYDDMIAEAFDDRFVFRLQESGPQSRYRLGDLEFCFRTKAEELLPVALASMVSKYVREVVMLQFNAFWRQHLPDLKPTKGYPVDAARFRDDIRETVERLQIDLDELWRCR